MCWLFCVSLLFFTFATSDSTLIDKLSKIKWNCADENCSVPISEGYGLRFYNGDDPLKLNFNENDQFLILGKSNDKFDNYWLVQAGDRKGIVPVQFVKERKVIINKGNQIVTELDLSSIIQPIKVEKNNKEAIKPSSPSIVIDGTTLPSYEDDSEVLVEEEREEGYESSQENSFYVPFNEPSPVKSDGLKKPDDQKPNDTETSEGFASNIVSNNVNTNESVSGQTIIENSGIKNSTDEQTGNSGLDQSQDLASDKVESVQVVNVSENLIKTDALHSGSNSEEGSAKVEVQNGNVSQESSFVANSGEANSVSDSEAQNVLMRDSKEEISVDVRGDLSDNTLENENLNDLPREKDDLESHLANKQNVVPPFELPAAVLPEQPDQKDSTDVNLSSSSKEEKSTATVTVPNNSAYVTPSPTEIPSSESPVTPTVVSHTEEASISAELNSPTGSETALPAKEEVFQQVTSLEFETRSPSPSVYLPPDSGLGKEDMTIPPSGMSNTYAEPFSDPSGSLLSSFAQPVANNKQSGPESPFPTEYTIEHTSNLNIDNSKPVNSAEYYPGSNPVSSMPATDPSLHDLSEDVSNTFSYTTSSNDLINNDTDNSDTLLKESLLNPQIEKPVNLNEEEKTRSDSDPSVVDRPNQEETVPETLPVNGLAKESNEKEDNSAFVEQAEESPDVIQDGEGWFSGISSIMSSFSEMFTKSDIGVNREDVTTTNEELVTSSESSNQQNDGDVTYCAKESCGEQKKDDLMDDNENKGSPFASVMLGDFSNSHMSTSTFICMIITSIVALLFSLGYYYLQNLKQDTALIAKINTVSTELFFAQKELASIEEQYRLANENYQRLVSETSHNETAIEELRKELEESKAARGLLEDEIKRLEKEIESLIEEGDEMHRMLAESFSEEERTKSLLANISDLKSVLSDRLQEIVSLTEQLDKEKQEVELLTISLKKSEEKREATEDKLTKVLIDADSKTLAVTKEFEEKISTLERIIEERSLERTNFEKQICELKGTCELLMVEKELAEKELKKAHGVSSGKALTEWLEAKNMKTDLLTVQKEVEKLKEALEESNNRGTLLEEKEKQLLNEIEELNNKYESAEKDKIEALTKLQVLSNYFKEKEIQLQEELGIKESQWLQKQSEDHTIYEQMRSLREENLSYKAQNEALKKEIIDQEASFKIQIANEEQKAQENWINLRHTERRLKEVQMEAAHLRSRLTALEANPDSLEDKHKSLEMVNGDVSMGAASPPFMLYPPPDYIPPPPLVSPTRPPPLGRLSSPPLTPPAPLSPFEFYPPPPPSPPPPLRVHKPQPREPHRKQKDSQSSNHSSESTEKPIRRGKR